MDTRSLPTIQEAYALYDRYGKSLEAEHYGEFVAISPTTGQTIIGPTRREVAQEALQILGDGMFLFKIGERVVGRWR